MPRTPTARITDMRPTVYLHEINFANLLYALALSLRSRVVVWNISVPNRFARRFERLRAYKLFSWDEWMLLEDASYAKWKGAVLPHYIASFHCEVSYREEHFDFSPVLWQQMGNSFERFYLFLATAKKHLTNSSGDGQIIAPLIATTLPASLVKELSSDVRLVFRPLASLFEAIHYWSVSFLRVASGFRTLIRGLIQPRINSYPKNVFWTGIAPQEVPEADHRLNFAWVAQYGQLRREDILFFLSSTPNDKQRAYLAHQHIDYADPVDMIRRLPRHIAIQATCTAFVFLIRDFLTQRAVVGAYRSRFLVRATIWRELARLLNPKFYFTTTSGCWPEQPEVVPLKQIGMQVIIWGYSANNLRFTAASPQFRDDTVYRSFFVAHEYWAWNKAVAEWLQRLQLNVVQSPTRFRVAGVHMCGNSAYLHAPPTETRRAIGVPEYGFYLGVFDVPALSDNWLDRQAGGPRYMPLEYSETFFSGIITLLARVPDIRILLKLKRSLTDKSRFYPPPLLDLVNLADDANSRVYLLDTNVDPFLPIAACDAALGMCFTSPVLLALANGRNGAYYDPLGIASFPTEMQYLNLILHNEEELITTVKNWVANRAPTSAPDIERLLPPSVENSFRHICYDADPNGVKREHG